MYLLIATPDNNGFTLAIGEQKIKKIVFVKKQYKQAELLLVEINKLIGKQKVTGVMVVAGPGAFSALRIGIATANALSYALKKPIVGLKYDSKQEIDREVADSLWNMGVKKLSKKCVWKMNCLVVPFYDKEPNITKAKPAI